MIAKISTYFQFGNFRENFIFASSVKGHICHVNMIFLHQIRTKSFHYFARVYFHETSHMQSFAKKPSRKFPNFTVRVSGPQRFKEENLSQ